MNVSKAVAASPEDPNLNKLLFGAGKSVGESLMKLTQASKVIVPKDTNVGRSTSTEVEERAEAELNAVSEAIDKSLEDLAAAMRAATDRAEKMQISPEEQSLTETVIEASQAIVKFTGILASAAASVQSEFVALIKEPKTAAVYQRDPQYAENLMAVAKSVLSAVKQLVKQTYDAALSGVSEDSITSAAQGVAAAATDLVIASTVKGDPNSPSQSKLKEAAARVALATAGLVSAVKSASAMMQEKSSKVDDGQKYALPEGKLLEMQKQMEILRMQKELEKLKRKQQQAAPKTAPEEPKTAVWNTNPASQRSPPPARGSVPTPKQNIPAPIVNDTPVSNSPNSRGPAPSGPTPSGPAPSKASGRPMPAAPGRAQNPTRRGPQ